MIKTQETSKTPTEKYDMKSPTGRNKFYRMLFENSGYVQGTSREARDIRIAFGDILTKRTNARIKRERDDSNEEKAKKLITKYRN